VNLRAIAEGRNWAIDGETKFTTETYKLGFAQSSEQFGIRRSVMLRRLTWHWSEEVVMKMIGLRV
jgi:hypothetical protein